MRKKLAQFDEESEQEGESDQDLDDHLHQRAEVSEKVDGL